MSLVAFYLLVKLFLLHIYVISIVLTFGEARATPHKRKYKMFQYFGNTSLQKGCVLNFQLVYRPAVGQTYVESHEQNKIHDTLALPCVLSDPFI
jgi:hypothetical protein